MARRSSFIRKSLIPTDVPTKGDYIKSLQAEKSEWRNIYSERKQLLRRIKQTYQSGLKVRYCEVEPMLDFTQNEFISNAPNYEVIVKDIEQFYENVRAFHEYKEDISDFYAVVKETLDEKEKMVSDELYQKNQTHLPIV